MLYFIYGLTDQIVFAEQQLGPVLYRCLTTWEIKSCVIFILVLRFLCTVDLMMLLIFKSFPTEFPSKYRNSFEKLAMQYC